MDFFFRGKRSKKQQHYVLLLWSNNILTLHYVTVEFSEVVTGEVNAKYVLAFYNLMLHTRLFTESCLGPDLLNCRCCAAKKKNKSACWGKNKKDDGNRKVHQASTLCSVVSFVFKDPIYKIISPFNVRVVLCMHSNTNRCGHVLSSLQCSEFLNIHWANRDITDIKGPLAFCEHFVSHDKVHKCIILQARGWGTTHTEGMWRSCCRCHSATSSVHSNWFFPKSKKMNFV